MCQICVHPVLTLSARIPSPNPCALSAAGKLEGYGSFGRDAVSAMPDIAADYAGSCGRCYEVKCRGIQARRWVGRRRLAAARSCGQQQAAAALFALMQKVQDCTATQWHSCQHKVRFTAAAMPTLQCRRCC